MVKVSVVVVNYQRAEMLPLCLWGLGQQNHPYELIVSDDGSTDGSVEIAMDGLATVITRPHDRWGTAAARWRGAQIASGELLVFVDSDIVLGPGAIEAYVSAYRKNPRRALGGYVKYLPGMEIDKPDWEALWAASYPRKEVDQGEIVIGKDAREAVGQMALYADPDLVWDEPLSLLGGSLAVPRDIYEVCGGWNKNMVGRGQDGEFSIRIALAGYGFSYLYEAKAVHIAHPVTRYEGPKPHEYLREKYPQCYVDGKFTWPPRSKK